MEDEVGQHYITGQTVMPPIFLFCSIYNLDM